MIQEQYVSFKTAKLLKEKGFDIPCCFNYRSAYPNTPKPFYHKLPKDFNSEEYKGLKSEWFSAPTQQMAMRWLRENYNILIYINFNGDINHYCWAMIDLTSGNPKPYECLAMTYEEAAEEAIKYCLENLI